MKKIVAETLMKEVGKMNADKLPKISIITPSFNAVKYIEEAIKSVLMQEYPNFEHISRWFNR